MSSHRWYNRNITRGEAEELLMREVKTMSAFKDPVIIRFSLVYSSNLGSTKKKQKKQNAIINSDNNI